MSQNSEKNQPGDVSLGSDDSNKKVILKPRKTFWHLYSLQTLGPEKFKKVVDKILKRDLGVVK